MGLFKYILLGTLALSFSISTTPLYAKKFETKKKDENEIRWEMHRSVTKIFDIKFPKKYKYKIFPFQFNNDTIAYSKEIIGSLDNKTKATKDKSLMVKAVQTFGSPLSYRDAEQILNATVRKYSMSAKELGGEILINENKKYDGFLGRNIYISYLNDGKKFGLRIKVYLTDYSKVEQILSGPASSMYSYRSDDFFNSLVLHSGRVKQENPLGVGWVKYPSKSNIFTAVLPPKNSNYTPNPPNFTIKDNVEVMNFVINDPVLQNNVRYNIYSYKGVSDFSYESVKSALFAKHVSKFVKDADLDSLKTENKTYKKYKSMKTKLIVTPTKKYPNITTIYLEARYNGDILVIQEFLCGRKHTNSGLNETLFSLMEFHPKKYELYEEGDNGDNKEPELEPELESKTETTSEIKTTPEPENVGAEGAKEGAENENTNTNTKEPASNDK